MEEKGNNEEGRAPFGVLIRPLDPEKGITARDYFDDLDCHVKGPLHLAYFELSELISVSGLSKADMERADAFLSVQRAAFMLWEQMDKKVVEDHQSRRAAEEGKKG
jgi:hypothetical protein